MPDPIRLRELLTRLIDADVCFVLVGGLAVNAWGYLRATRDVDVVPELPQIPPFAALDEKAKEVDIDAVSFESAHWSICWR